MEAKNEGRDIPRTDTNKISLSKNVSLYKAEKIPKNNPKIKAIPIEDIAKTNVFLNVSLIIEETEDPVLTNDSLR